MTQTMRSRLIEKIEAFGLGQFPLSEDRQVAEEIVDAILNELRAFKPEKDTVFLRFVTGDGTEDNHYADETDAKAFTAMIDAIRGEQA